MKDPRASKTTLRRMRWFFAVFMIGAIWSFSATSPAAVVGTRATVSGSVQELIADVPASVNGDSREFPAEGVTLPLSATAAVTSTDLNGALAGFGSASCRFLDPARLDDPNPQEFAVEVGCFSNIEMVSYDVTSRADEFRTVVFDRADVGVRPGASHEIESRVYLSGAVVAWTTDGAAMDSIHGELRVSVTREEDDSLLFETTLTLDGDSADSTGAIRFERVELDELAALGVDEASLAVLRQVDVGGGLVVLAIPPQEHAYTYTVTIDEPSTLHARLETTINNRPDGTGVAVALGSPFQDLASLIGTALPGVDGERLQKSVNQAVARRALGFVAAQDDGSSPVLDATPRYCGTLGMVPLGVMGFGLALIRRRTRWVG